MGYLAVVLFVALLAFGQRYFGWTDPGGSVQLALISAFVCGAICGFRGKT